MTWDTPIWKLILEKSEPILICSGVIAAIAGGALGRMILEIGGLSLAFIGALTIFYREYSQNLLRETRIQVDQVQLQLSDQQNQLNTYKNNLLSLERILQSIDNLITRLPEQQKNELWKNIRTLGHDQ
jgi:conjugal transfer/entry exclusion protein